MFKSTDLPAPLVTLASQQHGLLTREQMKEHLSERSIRTATRHLVRVTRGIYATCPPGWRAVALAGLMVGGDDAVLSGEAALFLDNVIRDQPQVIDVWHPSKILPFRYGNWTVRFPRGLRRAQDAWGLRRTSVETALLDRAATCDEKRIVSLLTRAYATRGTTPQRMAVAIAERRRLRHRALLEELADPVFVTVESVLEWLYHDRVERAHGLPAPQRQAQLLPWYRVDAWYEEQRVVVETDGRDHDDFARDMHRDNRLAMAFEATVLRYGWRDVTERPCAVARQVALVLKGRGWCGELQRCPRCDQG